MFQERAIIHIANDQTHFKNLSPISSQISTDQGPLKHHSPETTTCQEHVTEADFYCYYY